MPRVKRGTIANKRRRRILKAAKGYRFGRSKKEREARTALLHAGAHAYAHRRDKKNVFRQNWQVKINAAVRAAGLTYSQFIHQLKQKKIGLNRKMLAELAVNHPAIFQKIIETTQK